MKGRFAAKNVLIFGKTINAALLKNAIESIAEHQYKVVGFIEENENLWGKSIDNTKFYSFEHVKVIARKIQGKNYFHVNG